MNEPVQPVPNRALIYKRTGSTGLYMNTNRFDRLQTCSDAKVNPARIVFICGVGEVVRAATRSLSGGRKSTKFWPHCSSCHPKVCSQGAAGTQLVTGPILWSDLPSLGPRAVGAGWQVLQQCSITCSHRCQPPLRLPRCCRCDLPRPHKFYPSCRCWLQVLQQFNNTVSKRCQPHLFSNTCSQ